MANNASGLKRGFLACHKLLVQQIEPMGLMIDLIPKGIISTQEKDIIAQEAVPGFMTDKLLMYLHRKAVFNPDVYSEFLAVMEEEETLKNVVESVRAAAIQQGEGADYTYKPGVLDEAYSAALKEHEHTIVASLSAGDILPDLVSAGAVSPDENELIRNGVSSNGEQAKRLLKIVRQRGSAGFLKFKDALLDSESQQQLGKLLLRSEDASATLQSSALQVNWNFQNVPGIDSVQRFSINFNCTNPSMCPNSNCPYSEHPPVSRLNIINIADCTLQTSCEICVTAFDNTGISIASSKVKFRFDTYCAGHYYNISSNYQMVYISSNSAACFCCILPGQNISADGWRVNGKEDTNDINAEGTLIVTNTSEFFGDPKTNPMLECGNKAYNSSLTASIAYTTPAQIFGFPGDYGVMATANTTATLPYTIKCSAISGTQPIPTLTLQRVLSNGTAVVLNTTTSTSITSTLQSPDTGVYVCIATNSLGKDSKKLNLTVQEWLINTITPTSSIPSLLSNSSLLITPQEWPMNTITTTSPVPSLLSNSSHLNIHQENTVIIAVCTSAPIVIIICICLVLLGIQRYLKLANIDKQEIASLERSFKDHTAMWKMLSISSITTHLDKLETSTIDARGDLPHLAGNSSAACQDSGSNTAAIPSSSEQVALGYIAIPDVRSAICSDPHLHKEYPCSKNFESEIQGNTVPINPPTIIVTAESSSLLEKGTLRQSDIPPVISTGYCTIKTCDSDLKSGLQGAEIQGYVTSSQVCGTILNTEANIFDCTDHSKRPCTHVSSYIHSKQVTHDKSYTGKDPTIDTKSPLGSSCDQSIALDCTSIPEISSGVCSENHLTDDSACTTNFQFSAMSINPSENTPDIVPEEPGHSLEVWHSNADEPIEPMSTTLGNLTIKFGDSYTGMKTDLFGADITPWQKPGTLGSNTLDHSPVQCNIGFGYIDSEHVIVRDNTYENSKIDSELAFCYEHKVAIGYIGIPEIGSTICSENDLSEQPNCTHHMEAHHEKAVSVTEQPNDTLKASTLMCSDQEGPVTVDFEDISLYSDEMTMLSVYGANIQGYIGSPNTCI